MESHNVRPFGDIMTKVFYARVSTKDQDLDVQRAKAEEVGAEKIYEEKISEPAGWTGPPLALSTAAPIADIALPRKLIVCAQAGQSERQRGHLYLVFAPRRCGGALHQVLPRMGSKTGARRK